MSRRATNLDDGQNYDSFLDIVANLVGILVILIMVVGVRARNAWQDADQLDSAREPESTFVDAVAEAGVPTLEAIGDAASNELAEQEAERQRKESQLTAVSREVVSLQRSTFELESEMKQIQAVGYMKAIERDRLQLLVAAAEQALDEKKSELSEDQQRQLARQKAVVDAEHQLTEIEQQLSATRATIGAVQTLEHYPTPLAQTVFGHEEHFRLQDGSICYVPINEIVAVLQNDAENKVWKLKGTNQIAETIGPFDGFHVRYELARKDRRLPTPEGTVRRSTIELTRFSLLPIRDDLGEPVERAFATGSEFRQRLQRMNPRDTTITIWTYPNSFHQFRDVKLRLLNSGFLVAARPLPDGFPISGSPEGSRSAAE